MDALTERSPLHVSRTEHADGWTVVVDYSSLPATADHVTVELVGSEAVVAVDAPGRQTEFDVDLPSPGAVETRRNGVVTIAGGD